MSLTEGQVIVLILATCGLVCSAAATVLLLRDPAWPGWRVTLGVIRAGDGDE